MFIEDKVGDHIRTLYDRDHLNMTDKGFRKYIQIINQANQTYILHLDNEVIEIKGNHDSYKVVRGIIHKEYRDHIDVNDYNRTIHHYQIRVLLEYKLLISGYRMNIEKMVDLFEVSRHTIDGDIAMIKEALIGKSDFGDNRYPIDLIYNSEEKCYRFE